MDGKLFDDGKKKKKREYPPDPIWECLVAEFYPSGVPGTLRKRLNVACDELKTLGATPESIRARVAKYRQEWPKVACTPFSLVTNWDQFSVKSIHRPRRNEGIENEKDDHQYKRAMKEWLAQGNKP